jgi:hypothetical protein
VGVAAVNNFDVNLKITIDSCVTKKNTKEPIGMQNKNSGYEEF